MIAVLNPRIELFTYYQASEMNPFNCNQPASQNVMARESESDQSPSRSVDVINDLARGVNRINFEMVEMDQENQDQCYYMLDQHTTVNSQEQSRTKFQCYPLLKTDPKNIYKDPMNSDSSDENVMMDGMHDKSDEPDEARSSFLTVPKLTKQFLISPPASPPVGWEPIHEGSPVIDVQLITAIANLVPGKMHEIHSGNDSQPGIFVEVCEDAQFSNELEEQSKSYSKRIPKTMSPESFQRQSQQFHTIN